MKEHYFERTKGQSAIEYLMTYGWMLLVVAIVGGAIFATVQGQCVQSTSGFTGNDVQIENFGLDGANNLQLEVRNSGANSVNITGAQFDGDSNTVINESRSISATGDTGVVTITDVSGQDFESVDGCNDFDLTLEYTSGELDTQTTGSLTDSIELVTP